MIQSEPGKYLNTLAFRCTPDLVGDATVHVRHFDQETWKLWDDFDHQYRQRSKNDTVQAPYSIATTVLSMLSNGYVYFEKNARSPFLASLHPIDDTVLRRVFTLTYFLALGEDIGTIDLTAPPMLARRIADTRQVQYSLAESLTPVADHQPAIPAWIYRTAAWHLSRQLTRQPWGISESRTIPLHPDTTGGLVALDDPWENDQGGRYALSRTRLALKTLPNITTPVLLVTSRVTRISSSLIFAKHALAVQPGNNRPLLEVSLDGYSGARTINRFALQALGRLDMDYSILRAIEDRSRREQRISQDARANEEPIRFPREFPGQIWPIQPTNYKFPIGTGTGMAHLRLLHDHVGNIFGSALELLTMANVRFTLPHRPSDYPNISTEERDRRKQERERTGSDEPLVKRGSPFPTADSIMTSLQTRGYKKLRILCLWYQDETRLRMLHTFCTSFGIDSHGLDPHDGDELALHGDRIVAVFQRAAAFLEPGVPQGRQTAVSEFEVLLTGQEDVLVGAWCETEIPTIQTDTGAVSSTSGNPDPTAEDLDAKPQTRQVLAALGLPSQYLMGKKGGKTVQPPKADDHPALMALLDLYRSLGIIDQRIAKALEPEKRGYPVDRIAHAGIYVRQQNRQKGEFGQPKVVVTATTLIPPQSADDSWTLLGWSSTQPKWQPYHKAQVTFHATPYQKATGSRGTSRQRWDETAETIEQALSDLADELDGLPYVVTIDEEASRRLWSGLQNINQGRASTKAASRYWLPGQTLDHDDRPQAIIRLNIDADEVPRPISATQVFHSKKDHAVRETTSTLFQVDTDFGSPLWIFVNIPRGYEGGGRLGSKHTRWDAQRSVYSENKSERRKSEMPQNWYSMTASEIYPLACAKGVSEEALAITTAKQCHQTLFWSDRARYPVPLHAAQQMDLDHPQYRRTAPQDNLIAEPGTEDAVSAEPEA